MLICFKLHLLHFCLPAPGLTICSTRGCCFSSSSPISPACAGAQGRPGAAVLPPLPPLPRAKELRFPAATRRGFPPCAGLLRPDSLSQKPRRPAAEAHVALVSSAKDAAENGGGSETGLPAGAQQGRGGGGEKRGLPSASAPAESRTGGGSAPLGRFQPRLPPLDEAATLGTCREGRGQVNALSPWRRCRHATPPLSILCPPQKKTPVGGSLTTFLRSRTFPPAPPWRVLNPDPPFPAGASSGFVLPARAPALHGAQAGFAPGAD